MRGNVIFILTNLFQHLLK